jgi:ABC-type glycerol-3-phosphate transport system substrate-binding protein
MSRQISRETFEAKTTFLLGLILFIGLVGCGTQTPEFVTVTMVAGAVGSEYDLLKAQVTGFEIHSLDTYVQLFDLPESTGERYSNYTNLFQRHDPMIDVYMIDIIWPPEFGAAGWMLPLDDYVTANHIDMVDFLERPVQGHTWDGQLVSMPWFIDAGWRYCRVDLLARYGFTAAQTRAELVENSGTIVVEQQEISPRITFLISLEQQHYKAIHTTGHPSSRQVSFQNPDVPAANPHLIELFDVLVTAKPRSVHPRYSEISETIQPEKHRAMLGQQDAVTTTEARATAIQSIISPPVQEAIL